MRKILLPLLLAPILLHAQIITTVAGTGVAAYSGNGGQATAATLTTPSAVTIDATGNMYIADYGNNVIRMVTSAGVISTIAGNGTPGFAGDGGPATAAMLRNPNGIIKDASGNIYFCDYSNHCVRKINSSTGIITSIAGTGTAGYNGDGIPATTAQLNYPINLAIDGTGNIYVTDAANQRIRKVTATGTISTIAGTGTLGFSGDGGAATAATFSNPYGVVLDASGNIYVSDQTNNRIRKINTSGTITTICGTGTAGYSGNGAAATAAGISNPTQLWLDPSNNLLFADRANHAVRKINTTTGVITAVAGTGASGFSGDAGAATSAMLNDVSGVSTDAAGNIYVADFGNNRIRKVAATTGLDNLANNKVQVIVYPNPAHSQLFVTETSEKISEVAVINILGQQLREIQGINTNTYLLDVSELPSGMYVLQINNSQRVEFVKE